MADDWTRGIDRVCCMSSTSGRSFAFFPKLTGVLLREPALCRILAKGNVERSSLSISMPLDETEVSDPADDLRRLFVGLGDACAHSGTGLRRSKCVRRRLVYSPPLTVSSPSFTRSFRSRELPASDTTNLSSSLSSHAGASPPFCAEASWSTTAFPLDGPESRKKS